jgi:hypothetical protein
MKRLCIICFLFIAATLSSQPKTTQYHKGWPNKDGNINIREGFVNPPKGYGNVPFYWWSGDNLDTERLTWQLKLLADSATDGLCVSYNHTHPRVDTLMNANGYGGYGRVSSGDPYVFSPEWMKMWAEYSQKCAEYGIGLGLDDYVMASPGNGFKVDEALSDPGVKNHQGRIVKERIPAGEKLPDNVLKVKEYKDSVDVYYTIPSPELHPDYGKLMVEKYFQPFEDAMDARGREGMNYFFQDELIYDLNMRSWCDGMREIFQKEKGYDILPYLDALLATSDEEIDDEAARVRLDYAEVLTKLAEERYFKPIYDWNAERGLIYGCDNEGRGLNPTQYLDYFRAISWFTAPGNDAPARGSSFRQTKVSSSIAHLYGRPRTWLEAFHSMGWDANGGLLTRQLDHHLIAGGNLLCLHGLYYTTHGGWWEWAPPSFHFRMPYWPHMKVWLKYAERMCYVLSQGEHVCDIAILYPTETMQAYPDVRPDLAFNTALNLSDAGLDYDFIDYQSLQNAAIDHGSLTVAGETYKVLILAGVKAMHKETESKVEEFVKSGGLFLRINSEKETQDAVQGSLAQVIKDKIVPDFSTSSGKGKVLHRRVGQNDVYMVMDVPDGDRMTFRATGKAELWDAVHGTIRPVSVLKQEDGLTTVEYSGTEGGSELLVFSPGKPLKQKAKKEKTVESEVVPVEGEWDVEIIPTMDNRWGDFRLPKSDGFIGVEAREFRCYPTGNTAKAITAVYGYAPYMLTLNIPSDRNIDEVLGNLPEAGEWQAYPFSWQYGVFDSPGSQGYHGLKEHVDDRFLILDQGCHQLFRAFLDVPKDGSYRIVKKGKEPYKVLIDGKPVPGQKVVLNKGIHCLTIVYANTKKTGYSLEGMRGSTVDNRERSMVMLYPEGFSGPVPHGMHDEIVASSWYGTDYVPFVCPETSEWTMSFETAPGTRSMSFETSGKILEINVGGRKVDFKETGTGKYVADNLPVEPGVTTVTVKALPDSHSPGAAFFKEPVKLDCEGGRLAPGDWTNAGAMRFYSGGVKYSKEINVKAKGKRVELDLGDVDATCEVSVGGKHVDVLLSPPYKLDVTDFVKKGQNKVEVLVYSSLSNHYQTIPSPYKGTPRAGLIGPVRMIMEK